MTWGKVITHQLKFLHPGIDQDRNAIWSSSRKFPTCIGQIHYINCFCIKRIAYFSKSHLSILYSFKHHRHSFDLLLREDDHGTATFFWCQLMVLRLRLKCKAYRFCISIARIYRTYNVSRDQLASRLSMWHFLHPVPWSFSYYDQLDTLDQFILFLNPNHIFLLCPLWNWVA
jgi:hypothetical protein